MTDTAYIVLESKSGEQLAVLVNGALKQGWSLQGGISVCQMLQEHDYGILGSRLSPKRMSYTQALIKTG